MSDVVRVTVKDETHLVVRSSPAVMHELKDRFTFRVPGCERMPLYRAGIWDGNIALYNPLKPVLYRGLLTELIRWCKKNNYDADVDPACAPRGVSYMGREDDLREWARSVVKPSVENRDYQVEAFVKGATRDRGIFLSSTSSGKTLQIYRLCRFHRENTGKPALVITKRTNLVDQMVKDFHSYSPDAISVMGVKGGVEKSRLTGDYVVSTWQSASKMDREWLNQFGCVCVDECHSADAKVLAGMMEKCTSVAFRYGFTGTMKEAKSSEMALVGLFGPLVQVSTTRERIAAGDVADLKITVVHVDWPAEDKKAVSKLSVSKKGKRKPAEYAPEIDYIIKDQRRLALVADYASQLRGNVLVLFNRNEDFGLPLYEEMKKRIPEEKLRLVYGATEDEDRESVREIMEAEEGVFTLASLGTFAEGTSINNIKHLMLVYPVKGKIRLLQSIGRGLRKHEDKKYCHFHDFADDLRTTRHVNYAWRHLEERLQAYDDEGFEYSFVRVELS